MRADNLPVGKFTVLHATKPRCNGDSGILEEEKGDHLT